MQPFCDYCNCLDCINGTNYLTHAKTINNKWICEICFCFDICLIGPNKNNFPCNDIKCEHRPKLVSFWEKMA